LQVKEPDMILHGLSPEVLARLLSLDRAGDRDSWLLYGPTAAFAVEAETEPEDSGEAPLRWAAE
jgi:hypothetical protein